MLTRALEDLYKAGQLPRAIEVSGVLRARPERADVVHRLGFPGIDESRFVGDHTMAPYETDVGVWVLAGGALDLQGTRKRPWTHLSGAADAGASSITVADAAGWQIGDEIVVTPTEPTSVDGYAEHHDRRVVTTVQEDPDFTRLGWGEGTLEV